MTAPPTVISTATVLAVIAVPPPVVTLIVAAAVALAPSVVFPLVAAFVSLRILVFISTAHVPLAAPATSLAAAAIVLHSRIRLTATDAHLQRHARADVLPRAATAAASAVTVVLVPRNSASAAADVVVSAIAPALLHSAALTLVLLSRLTTTVPIAVALPTALPLVVVLLLVVAISPAAAAAPTVAALIMPIAAATTVSISRPIVSTAVAHSCARRTGSSQCRRSTGTHGNRAASSSAAFAARPPPLRLSPATSPPAPSFPASQRAHRSTGLLASAGAAVLCCAVRACGARCPAAQRCVPYYAALLRVCLHDYSSEVHEGFAPSPCNAWSVLPVLISFTSLRAIMDGIRHLPYVTYFTPPTAAVSPVVFNTPPYPVTARVCVNRRALTVPHATGMVTRISSRRALS